MNSACRRKIQTDKYYHYRPRHSAWKNSCDSLTVAELHENWTRVNLGIKGLRNLGILSI